MFNLSAFKNIIAHIFLLQPARHSKLEKADILEMTVKHLQTIQRQQMSLAVSADPGVIQKFRSGFSECAGEVTRYMSAGSAGGVEAGVRQRLVAHLTSCVQQMAPTPAASVQQGLTPEDVNNNTASARLQTLQLIPSRLPSGELALLLPNSQHLPLFPENQVSTTSDSPVAVSSSRGSAFTAVNRDRSPLHSPSSTTASDSPSPALPPEVTSSSDRHSFLPQCPSSSMSAIQTPLTVITNNDILKDHSQRFLEIRSQQPDLKNPLDFSIKKDSFHQPFSPPSGYKRPYTENSSDNLLIKSSDLQPPLKIPKYNSVDTQIIQQPERRLFEIQNRTPKSLLDYRLRPGPTQEGSDLMEIQHQPSTSTGGSRDMWRPW